LSKIVFRSFVCDCHVTQAEKELPKSKGIISQSVKECVDELVGDSMIDQDKIGSSNFFWAFPSKGLKKRSVRIDKLQEEVQVAKDQLATLGAKRKAASADRVEGVERQAVLARLRAARAEDSTLTSELAKVADVDPDRIALVGS
jgi:hypothetical protein